MRDGTTSSQLFLKKKFRKSERSFSSSSALTPTKSSVPSGRPELDEDIIYYSDFFPLELSKYLKKSLSGSIRSTSDLFSKVD